MSSYDQTFFRIWKYGSSVFKRTLNHVSMTSSYVFTLLHICVLKSSKKGLTGQIRASTWLLASYIAEVSNQVTPPDWVIVFFDFFNCINDFWATRRSPGAIKISTDSWDDVLHDLVIYVSRSGKFTAFYIPYISHIVEMTYADHTVISDISSIWGGIHKTTSS